MSESVILQFAFFMIIMCIFIKPLGLYMAYVFENKPCFLSPVLRPIEQLCYRFCGIKVNVEMNWKQYLIALLSFNFMAFMFLLVMLMTQKWLPLNPNHFDNLPFPLALNTAISYMTNTNWQAFAGETTMSYFSQMLGLAVHNFISAATGMTVAVVLIRGFARKETIGIGNFWVDLIRVILYILLPLSLIIAILLMSQGVIQNFHPYLHVLGLDLNSGQTLPMGPVASQEAIKNLGTNGGGFFNANSAHPFANPTPFSNFIEALAVLLIPTGLCYTFGHMVRDVRQGWAIFFAMTLIFIPCFLLATWLEQNGNPQWQNLSNVQIGAISTPTLSAPGGNMEGKELRFGIDDSVLFNIADTATSTGGVNSVTTSYTPLGGMVPLFLMQLGEVIYGGVGSGLYSMLIMMIITVFIAGLMVGRTPEYLGKKIETFEMKMTALVILIMPAVVLISTAIACVNKEVVASLSQIGPHGFTTILYAFTSMANNNGSAFTNLNPDTNFFNYLGSIVLLLGRFGVIIPVLAIAGSLAMKKNIPIGLGTLPTHTTFFITMLVFVVLIVAGLTFIPSLALGPIVENLQMYNM